MHGGVTGKASDGLPMSISDDQSSTENRSYNSYRTYMFLFFGAGERELR
jgi:hypothetical protein